MKKVYHAVLFDLLSALIDSWTLWDELAGNARLGRKWRMHYLLATYHAGGYTPYLPLVLESAAAVGISQIQAARIADRWDELEPWPEASGVVAELAVSNKVGVVTNCSEALGQAAANRLGVNFNVVLSAERAGYYKPDPNIYGQAIAELNETPDRILYVAGSPYDVRGAVAAGMTTYWHNRIDLKDSVASSLAARESASLHEVKELLN
jgi:2-haloalkanoic acid dehalogenase type II